MQPVQHFHPGTAGEPVWQAWAAALDRRERAPLSYHELTLLMVRTLEFRDPGAGRHARGVAEFATMLAAQIGMEPERIEVLRYAAALHDAVITKPTRLTPAEWLMIQDHPMLGYDLVRSLRLDSMIMDAILCHHENFDGSGYPLGLKGEDIPLAARLIRVADFCDALTDRRRYRERVVYTLPEALEVMQKNSHCFDPFLLSEFLEMMKGANPHAPARRMIAL